MIGHAGGETPYRTDDAQALRREERPGDAPNIWRPAFVRDVEKIIHTARVQPLCRKGRRSSASAATTTCRAAACTCSSWRRIARDIGYALGLNTDPHRGPSASATTSATHPSAMRGSAVSTRCSTSARDAGSFTTCIPCACSTCSTVGTSPCRCSTGALTHNGEYEQQVFELSGLSGFEAFDDVVERCYTQGGLAIGHLRPMTLEGCVVRISDIIAYVGRDRQDAIEAGLLGEDAFEDGLGGAYNSWILSHAAADIIEHSYGSDRIAMSEDPLFGDSARQGGELRQDLPLERYRGRARRGARASLPPGVRPLPRRPRPPR